MILVINDFNSDILMNANNEKPDKIRKRGV